MKLASIGYVPPPEFGCAKEFYENLMKFPAAHELILFSEYAWPGAIQIPDPIDFKNATFPDGKPNPFALNNVLFLTALRIARRQEISHIIFLESDCRVGVKAWDDVIFEEYFSLGRPTIAAGTLACYNPCNYSPEGARRWVKLVSRNDRRNHPVATYGYLSAAVKAPSCVFPNGALAVYDVAWMGQLWDLENTGACAMANSAFDMILGTLVWERFAEDSYEVLGYLESIFSSYGDVLTSEEDRLQLLRDGKAVAVHQVKSKATI